MPIENNSSQVGPIEDSLLSIDDDSKVIFKKFRSDNSFCDVTFTCRDHVFDAHRIVMSSYSRWLQAILQSRGEKVVLPVDFFEPISFGAVLEYMYGDYIFISVKNVEDILFITKKMEMQKLEHDIFKLLCSDVIINRSNCKYMLYLSERFDNLPLRHKAWHILQKSDPSGFNLHHLVSNSNSDYNSECENEGNVSMTTNTATSGSGGFTDAGTQPKIIISQQQKQLQQSSSSSSSLPHKHSTALHVVEYWTKRLTASGTSAASAERNDVDVTLFPWSSLYTKPEDHDSHNSNNKNDKINRVPETDTAAAVANNSINNVSNIVINSADDGTYDNNNITNFTGHDGNNEMDNNNNEDEEEEDSNNEDEDECIDLELLITDVYRSMDMESRVAAVPKILEAFAGREKDLIARLLVKYAHQLSPMMRERLEEVM